MARTTFTAVKQLLPETQLTKAVIESIIDGASIMVTNVLGTTLDADILTEIERWLAAHMCAISRERQIKKAGAAGAEVEYTGYWSYGLTGTTYGQMVLTLDTTGAMAEANSNAILNPRRPAYVRAIRSFDS